MGKNSNKKQRALLAIAVVMLILAALFTLRAYYGDQYGIFAADENEEVKMLIGVRTGKISDKNCTFSNTAIDYYDGIALKDVTRSGFAECWVTNYERDNLTRFIFTEQIPGGCDGNITSKMKFCDIDESGNVACENDWKQGLGHQYIPSEPVNPQIIKFRFDITPCRDNSTGGGDV